MAGGLIEMTPELWASSRRGIKARVRPVCAAARVNQPAFQFIGRATDGKVGAFYGQ